MRNQFYRITAVVLFGGAGLLGFVSGCSDSDGLVQILDAVRDDDDDGWFTHAKNQRVTLHLVSAVFPAPGDYYVEVDGVRFGSVGATIDGFISSPIGASSVDINRVVAKRCVGAWMLNHDDMIVPFTSNVRVVGALGGGDTSYATVNWNNRTDSISRTVNRGLAGSVQLQFEVRIELFADPSPDDALGDSDNDGIPDIMEASLAEAGQRLGDPERKDLALVVAHTHPTWRITDLSRQLLMTKFHERGINFYIAHEPSDTVVFSRAGQAFMDNAATASNFHPSLDDAVAIRAAAVGNLGDTDAFAFFCVLAEDTTPPAWGWNRGRNLIVRSHLPFLGADLHQYQAKTIMHELGHGLGLCHPTESDNCCPTGAIPQSERSGGASAMGTPAEADGPIHAMIDALSRPLDYTPTQWNNLNLDTESITNPCN